MLKGFDRIVKEKLENLSVPGTSDWTVFSKFLDIELSATDEELELDHEVESSLGEYNVSAIHEPQWDLFESRLDEFNAAEDRSFDNEIKSSLSDSSFPWNENHWELMSAKLDVFNNRPRILLLKVMEVAAVLLVLLQLPGIYNTVRTTLDHNQFSHQSEITTPSDNARSATESGDIKEEIAAHDKGFDITANLAASDLSAIAGRSANSKGNGTSATNRELIVKPIEHKDHFVVYDQFATDSENSLMNDEPLSLIDMPSVKIKNSEMPREVLKRLPSLSSKNISIVNTPMDSILSSVAVVSVLRPKLQSSLEVGFFADVTEAIINDRFIDQSYNELLVNPGTFFRYKLQYGKVFGSLGADYVEMEYAGAIKENKITMVSLPIELGYNFVNLPAFRMYVSTGIAGRFVPKAEYSEVAFDNSSQYNELNPGGRQKGGTDYGGLLNKGPFEINSYLSGRISVGMDANVNKNMSIGLRLSHDAWLKGKGIGYNYDTFKSSQLALGLNYHF